MTDQFGEAASARIAPNVLDSMRQAIEDTGGREVFFAGSVNADGVVTAVRVCARGNDTAVPALLEGLRTREVVVHNHPSGDLEPSEADLHLASVFASQGHGVFIVDNAVERIYVIVEPFLDKDRSPLDPAELDTIFVSEGALAAHLAPYYEARPQQVDMTRTVADAFNRDGIAIIEAPTGIGKTMAYLIPAILWAVRNRERVVMSTKTINLQEQIIHKDIPILEQCLGVEFNTVLVKGRSNYLCWRRFERAMSEATLFDDENDEAVLKSIAQWAEKTNDGSLSDLPFVPPRDLWTQICSESDTCRFTNCPNIKRCFIGNARREVAKADLLVVNHHMLFSDLAIKRETGDFSAMAVLPAFGRLILDEAHSVEDSATEYFGMEATRNGALALIGRFVRRERNQERGLLPYLKARLLQDLPDASHELIDRVLYRIDTELEPALASMRQGVISAFQALRSLTADRCGQIGRDVKWRLTQDNLNDPELREIHTVYIQPLAQESIDCARHCGKLLEYLRDLRSEWNGDDEFPLLTELMQLQAYGLRLERLAANLAEGTSAELQPNTVRWIEIDSQNNSIVRLVRCPLDVGESLSEWVYANLKTIVMTSATLSVQQRFDYLFGRIGLDRVPKPRIQSRILPTPFDFQSQAILCIATDIPAPNEKNYLDECVSAIGEILSITKGHAFVLFTSFYALDFVHSRLNDPLRRQGIVAMRQGEAARTRLLDRFRRDASSVLFGTDSFWEGVDVAGEALQCVILPKLPFRVPTEPILEARAEAIDAAGGNAFMEYTVPQAVIKFRQGFGRLIRRTTDRGAIVLLDQRVVTKYYGRVFLESLPGLRIVKGPRKGIQGALSSFFNRKDEETA